MTQIGGSWRKLAVRAAIAVPVLFTVLMILFAFIDPLLIGFCLIFLVGAWWANRPGRGGLIFLAIISILFFLANIPFLIPAFSVPADYTGFISTGFITLADLTAAIASIAALRTRDANSNGTRTLVRAVGVLAVVFVVIAVVARLTFDEATRQEGDLALVAQDISYSTDTLDAESGKVAVFIENKDNLLHTFTIDDLDVDVDVPGGTTVRVVFDADAGDYRFYCRPHEGDMHGTLEVQ